MAFLTGRGSIFDMGERFPILGKKNESSVQGVFIAGDATGSPDIKAALNQGREVARHIADTLPEGPQGLDYDVVIVGGGPSGVAAALEFEKAGVRYLILERKLLFHTLRSFARCKLLYYPSTGERTVRAALPFDRDVASCDLVEDWEKILEDHPPVVSLGETVKDIQSRKVITVRTDKRDYTCQRVILAVGRLIHFKKLDVAEEGEPKVHYELPNPEDVVGKDVLVVGLTDGALETVAGLAERNRVTLACQGEDPAGCNLGSIEALRRLEEQGKITVYSEGVVTRLGEREAVLRQQGKEVTLPNDVVYMLAGVDRTSLPTDFYKRCKIAYDRDWHLWRSFGLIFSILLVGAFYLTKKIHPDLIRIGSWNLDKLYPLTYSVVVLVFGIKAIRRWGAFRWKPSPRKHGNQTLRLSSLIFFQVFFFFIVPELLVHDWMAYSIFYPWPLVLGPSTIQSIMQSYGYWVWGLALILVGVPLSVLFHGKKFCTWVCGCGGLAETVGDSWRHYSPKGPLNRRRERYIYVVTGFALIATVVVAFGWDVSLGGWNIKKVYGYTVDLLLIAIIPVALYPFAGGKTWCRYWCPVVGWMNIVGKKMSRFRITPDKKRCIACGMCTRYCEVGVDVMQFALRGEAFGLNNSACIGCGICLQVCPTDVLEFGKPLVQIGDSNPAATPTA